MNQTIDLIELLRILLRRKAVPIAIGIIVAILALVISFIIPKKYMAHTSVIIPESSQTKALSGFSSQAFNMAGLSLPTESTQSFTEIIRSQRIFQQVVNENDLRKYYGFPDDKSQDQKLYRKMSDRLAISPIRDNVLHLYFEDHDPEKASQIANSFIQNLRIFLDKSILTSTENAKNFIEEQIDQVKTELTTAEEALKIFTMQNKAAGIDEQIIQTVRQASSLQAERDAAQIALDLAHQNIMDEKNRKDEFSRKYKGISKEYDKFSLGYESDEDRNLLETPPSEISDLSDLPDEFLKDTAVINLRDKLTELKVKLLEEKFTKTEKHPAVVKINDEIYKTRGLFMDEVKNVLDSHLASLEFERVSREAEIQAYNSVLSGYEKSWSALPEKSTEYIRLQRDVEALSQVYLMLKNQLAQTKIDVAREKKYFEVLDPAVPPDRPVSPKPLNNTIIGFIVGLIIGIIWLYFGALIEMRQKGAELQ